MWARSLKWQRFEQCTDPTQLVSMIDHGDLTQHQAVAVATRPPRRARNPFDTPRTVNTANTANTCIHVLSSQASSFIYLPKPCCMPRFQCLRGWNRPYPACRRPNDGTSRSSTAFVACSGVRATAPVDS